jgi:N-acyl-D-aspartate/D-glutamate deacylase
MISRLLLLLLWLGFAAPVGAQTYDIVLSGGRVMDPESGLDAVRNVGITADRIARISTEPLAARRVIDARGLVIAPGFIDVHQHAQDAASGRLKAFDGVTTALEMEIGVPDVASFLQRKKGHSLINYGTTASHAAARSRAFDTPFSEPTLVAPSGAATDQPATPQQLARIEDRLNSELDAGALGIGMGIQYTPGASHLEVIRMFRLAAQRGVTVFTHVRSFGRIEPGSSVEAVSEVIGAAAVSGASLQIAHINSSCIADAPECL